MAIYEKFENPLICEHNTKHFRVLTSFQVFSIQSSARPCHDGHSRVTITPLDAFGGSMNRISGIAAAAIVLVAVGIASAAEPKPASNTWSFAASGDSRNCGDVVMPAIAVDATKHNAA